MCIIANLPVFMYQSIPAVSSPPGLLEGICPPFQSWGWGICKFCAARGSGICQPRGYSGTFETRAVSYQNITTQRILLKKKKIGGCKCMFSILCMHLFIAQVKLSRCYLLSLTSKHLNFLFRMFYKA